MLIFGFFIRDIVNSKTNLEMYTYHDGSGALALFFSLDFKFVNANF
jgi:hypothetical protein